MAGNSNLHKANKAKNDEFYTQLSDIEAELKHYRKHFAGKTVLCNCDDPYESNFFKYFAMNFNFLGLKKLIATCYKGSPVMGKQLSCLEILSNIKAYTNKTAYKIEITEVTDTDGDGAVTLCDVEYLLRNQKNTLALLDGDGDFRSQECIELLKQSDIVVTNPPFSLFREYIAQLFEYNKKFLIIGNKNAITYKEIFPLLKDDKMWTGCRGFAGGMWFYSDYEGKTEKNIENKKVINVPSIWFTNLDHKKRHEELELYKKYTPEEYPKYDNYNAINVDKVADMPEDYYGVMGVPITFLDKYNPEQFEIIKFRKGNDEKDLSIDGKCPYFRILIRRKQNGN